MEQTTARRELFSMDVFGVPLEGTYHFALATKETARASCCLLGFPRPGLRTEIPASTGPNHLQILDIPHFALTCPARVTPAEMYSRSRYRSLVQGARDRSL